MTKRIVPFVPFTAADPTDLTFSQLKKEIRRGEISKICKSQGWRGGLATFAS